MVKLSDVKAVRPHYRIRVRYRLLALEYAAVHGPTAAGRHYGVSPRTCEGGGLAGDLRASPGWFPGTGSGG